MEHLIYLSIAMAFGIGLIKIMKFFNLPNVTGYLLAGVIAGPYCLNLLTKNMTSDFDIFVTVALGFIAFSIGNEFKLSHIKNLGLSVIFITICESLGAVILVDFLLIILKVPLPVAITLGAMAATTAPAATLLVVRQYNARGPLTDNLLPVVAMDDAVGLIAYSISVSIANSIANGVKFEIFSTVILPIFNIILSLIVGILIGAIIAFIFKFYRMEQYRMMICICAVFSGLSISSYFGLQNLLICMAIGASLVNFSYDGVGVLHHVETWTDPLFMLFFVISGAELDFSVIPTIGVIGVVYILGRVVGKYIGTYFGATVVKSSKTVRKYLGLALLPQAGVAIGMSQLALSQLPQYGKQIQTVILVGTLCYEFVGPIVAKLALEKAGEISPRRAGRLNL